MKLLFNLEVVPGRRVGARPGDYLRSLPHDAQVAALSEFLRGSERTARESDDARMRAEAGIGIATVGEHLQTLCNSAPRIDTRGRREEADD